jgi:hypothetical protein
LWQETRAAADQTAETRKPLWLPMPLPNRVDMGLVQQGKTLLRFEFGAKMARESTPIVVRPQSLRLGVSASWRFSSYPGPRL